MNGLNPVVINSSYRPPADAILSASGYVLWVARICPWKRPEWFVQLAQRLPQFRFRMIGGPGTEPGEAIFADAIRRQAAGVPNLGICLFCSPR